MQNLQDIERLVSSGHLDEAVGRLSLMIADVDVASDSRLLSDLYFRRGKLYWRLGRRGDATSDYTKASALDPGSPAVIALEQARDVEAFFNPDLYNP
ncbi:MAG: hypothetical protein K2I24_09185 [Duncaniella sp.]|nr:hypothetical protein [Duncaniella sp.]